MRDPRRGALPRVTEKAFRTAQWVGYIKDCDGGAPMECVFHAALPYHGSPKRRSVLRSGWASSRTATAARRWSDPRRAALPRVTEKALRNAQWVGYIVDYDGGTLMECVLHAALPYHESLNRRSVTRRGWASSRTATAAR